MASLIQKERLERRDLKERRKKEREEDDQIKNLFSFFDRPGDLVG